MACNNKVLGGGGFHHVAIRSRDFDKTLAFYTQVLGFAPRIHWQQAPKRAAMLDTGDGNYLEVFEDLDAPEQDPGDSPILHFAIRCNDVDAAIQLVRDAGCGVTMEPRSLDIQATEQTVPVRIAFFKGPGGELIEFFQNELT